MNNLSFTSFFGNSGVKLPHAIILEGEKGLGKKTLAKIIAAAAVCRNEGQRPCGVCSQCIKAQAGSHPDISFIEGTGKMGGIPVDYIRKVRGDAYIVPSEAEKKVFILVDADNTGVAAQNAFLKVFEEPPKFSVFIITCESSANLLETIRSRAVAFTLAPVSTDEVINAVNGQGIQCEPDILNQAAIVSGGNIGKAIASLNDNKFILINQSVSDLVQGLVSPTEAQLLTALHLLEKDRDLARSVLDSFELCLRDALCAKCEGSGQLGANPEATAAIVRYINTKQILSLLENLEKISLPLDRFTGMPLAMTYACALMRKSVGK